MYCNTVMNSICLLTYMVLDGPLEELCCAISAFAPRRSTRKGLLLTANHGAGDIAPFLSLSLKPEIIIQLFFSNLLGTPTPTSFVLGRLESFTIRWQAVLDLNR